MTPKQDKFARAYVETGNASEAYRTAYDTAKMKAETINRNAHELLNNSKVAARIAELQQYHADRHAITVDSLTAELEEARLLAEKEGQAAAMVSATMGKAKLHGMIIDRAKQKIDHGVTDGVAELMRDLTGMTPRIPGERR
jgi:phage terminase small subunit